MSRSRFQGQPTRTSYHDHSPIIHDKYMELTEHIDIHAMETGGAITHSVVQTWINTNLNAHTTRIIAFRYYQIHSKYLNKQECINQISLIIVQTEHWANILAVVFGVNELQNPSGKRYLTLLSETVREEETKECPICYNDIAGCEIIATNCGHNFCQSCISTHVDKTELSKFVACPCCRTDVTSLHASCSKIHQELKEKYN